VIPDGESMRDRVILGDVVQPEQMRASDEDRERIAALLRDAHTEGRLTQDEFTERLESTYTATTYRDLDLLIGDLPIAGQRGQLTPSRKGPVSRPPTPSPLRQKTRKAVRKTLNGMWWIYAAVVAACVMIWLIVELTTSPGVPFWPAWVAGPWGLVLGFGELAYRRGEPPKQR
jgi:uncharacterized membrane protein